MKSRRWLQIEKLYYSALPLNQHERNKFFATTCEGDAVLRAEVNSLLAADESSGDFLENSMLQVGLTILADNNPNTVTDSDERGTASDSLVGTMVDGRYEIVERVGSGGIGDVYRAHDTKVLFRKVVIKVLKDSSLSTPWIVTKFEQEIEALTKITDPGVAGIIDAGKLPDGKPYLVMELVEGCNLREFIQSNESARGPLDFHEIADIVKQVGRTVTSAHDAGVVHRDLKPANIMVRRNTSGDLQVKVIDFGIAKITNSATANSTAPGLVVGTLHYMAPEQLHGLRVRPVTDVYALGIITYEMVTGIRPFNPKSAVQLAELQKAGVKVPPIDLRPDLPLAAQHAIFKALSYDPSDRYQRARDFGDAVSEALIGDDPARSISATHPASFGSGEPASAADSHLELLDKDKPTLPARRFNGSAVGLAALLSVMLIGGVGFSIWHYSRNLNPERTLTYSLTVQKMRDGKEYQDPFQSSGQEIFENGYAFRLNISSSQSGYFYIFNEDTTNMGDGSLTIIYPTTETNSGSAKLAANQKLQTNWNRFAGQAGTEQLWMIWSASQVPELETARDAAFKSEKGAVADPGLRRIVREFLGKHSEPKPETTKDAARQETTVLGSGDLLVKLVELEHR